MIAFCDVKMVICAKVDFTYLFIDLFMIKYAYIKFKGVKNMYLSIRRGIAAAIAASVVMTSAPMVAYSAESGERTVVVFHTNDMHGSLQGSGSVIGVDKVAAMKKQYDNAILADGGDAAQGVALASLSKGEDVIELMNTAGYDVMAAGNHEFDYGLAQLRKFMEIADFPIISANTYYEGEPFFSEGDSDGCSTIIEKNGVKVGFFGLTTKNTATSTNPKGIAGIEFKDEVDTAKEQVESLDERGADVIIAITHMGILEEEADCTSRELAEAMADTELDAIIDGHSHSVLNEKVGNIVIGQTGTGLSGLGKMEITVDENGNADITETLLTAEDLKDIAPDEQTAEKLKDITASQEVMLKEKIGETKGTLWGGSINQIAESRVGETNFGSLISDAIIAGVNEIIPEEYKGMPIVSVVNGGGFRSAVPNGDITVGHIINALPFANTIMYKVVSPAVIYDMLESSVSTVNWQDNDTGFMDAAYSGSFLQIGGMRFEYDPNGEKGERVKAVYLDDQSEALDRNDRDTDILLGSNDYVIGLGVLEDIPLAGEGSGLEQAVTDYIKELTDNGSKALSLPVTYGRIKTVGEYKPKEYTANVRVNSADGQAAPAGKTGLYIDGVRSEGIIDTDGVLSFTVTDGPHSIKLYEDQQEVYVNNYSGAGVIESYGQWEAGFPVLTLSESVEETDTESTTKAIASSSGASRGGKIRNVGSVITETTTAEKETEETTRDNDSVNLSDVKVTAGSNKLTVGNTSYEMNARPYIQADSDSLLVPLRYISVALGGNDISDADDNALIQWDAYNKTAILYVGEGTVSFKVGSSTMMIGNRAVEMDNGVKAEIKEGRMYIPFRALGQALDIDVTWDADTRSAIYASK